MKPINIEKKLAKLVLKLKGKSVYKNLELISKKKCKNKIREIIGISSLLTHSLIEMEENPDYKEVSKFLLKQVQLLLDSLD